MDPARPGGRPAGLADGGAERPPGGHREHLGRADPAERLRARARAGLRWLRSTPADHHGEYPGEVRAGLPYGTGTPPAAVVREVAEAGWPTPRLVRLRDVEWAERQALRLPERIVGLPPRFAVVAGA